MVAAPDSFPSSVGEPDRTPHNTAFNRLFGTIVSLRLMVIGTILVPLLAGSLAIYVSFQQNYEKAVSTASQLASLSAEITATLLDANLLIAIQINNLLGGMTDDQTHLSETTLHEKVAQEIAAAPYVAAAWVISATGHELVSARVYPVNQDLDHSARDDFRAFQTPDVRTFVSVFRARSREGDEKLPYWTLSLRRSGTDGRFDGVVIVSVAGSHFASFYNSLPNSAEPYTVRLLNADGTVLASYPELAGPLTSLLPDPLLAKAVADEARTAITESGSLFGGAGRIVAVKKVANHPIYAAIERTKASILWASLRAGAGYILICVVSGFALAVLGMLAVHRARSERFALARASQASAQLAAIEVQLHRARRDEAVSLVAAGFAQELRNLLAFVREDNEQLEPVVGDRASIAGRRIEAAKDSCERTAKLTAELLGLISQEPIRPHPIDVNEVVEHTLNLPWHAGSDIVDEMRLDHELWSVCVDTDQLATILLMLALRMSTGMIEGDRLAVETINCSFRDDNRAEEPDAPQGEFVGIFVRVRQTGPVASPQMRGRVVDPTGRGLSLIHAFATRYGGACTIEGNLDEGAMVRLYLPRHIDRDFGGNKTKAAMSNTFPRGPHPTL